MTNRMAHRGTLVFVCAIFVLCACLGLASCGKPEASPGNQTTSNQATSPDNQAIQEFKQGADAAQAAALIESQREADRQTEASSAASIQEAYDKNPQSVEAGSANHSEAVKLTGIVRMKRGLNKGTQRYEDVYVLVLPGSIEVTGTQYGPVSGDMVILDSDYVAFAGKVVTLNMHLEVCVTSSLASAEYSSIHGKEGYVDKVL